MDILFIKEQQNTPVLKYSFSIVGSLFWGFLMPRVIHGITCNDKLQQVLKFHVSSFFEFFEHAFFVRPFVGLNIDLWFAFALEKISAQHFQRFKASDTI